MIYRSIRFTLFTVYLLASTCTEDGSCIGKEAFKQGAAFNESDTVTPITRRLVTLPSSKPNCVSSSTGKGVSSRASPTTTIRSSTKSQTATVSSPPQSKTDERSAP